MPAVLPQRHVRVETVMGMPTSIHVLAARDIDRDAIDAAANATFAQLRDIDRLFSTYRADSEISRIGRGELDLADADDRVRHVAEACRRFETESNGLFSAFWRDEFDPTGYVKGWAVEAAARTHLYPLMSEPGIVAAGVNAGGDMQLFTAPAAKWMWRIGIADPAHPGSLVATVEVRNGAVATSGTAERGTHIIDPRTGVAATGLSSATVVDASLTRADLWATTAMVAGFDDLSWVHASGTRTGIFVGADGRVRRWIDGVEMSVVTAGVSGLRTPEVAA